MKTVDLHYSDIGSALEAPIIQLNQSQKYGNRRLSLIFVNLKGQEHSYSQNLSLTIPTPFQQS